MAWHLIKHREKFTVTTFLHYWFLAFRGIVRVILLMRQQFVITHAIYQTMISTLLDSWVTNAPSIKMLCPQKKSCLSIDFRKNMTCLHVGLLRIWQVFSVSCIFVYWWVMTNCSLMSDMFVTDLNESVWAHMADESTFLQPCNCVDSVISFSCCLD
jgi:hypothetical protein